MPPTSRANDFLTLHTPGSPFVMPNPWDVGSARILAAEGYPALATTSAGFAMTLGRKDYSVSRQEALTHAAAIADAVDVPVSADLENGFGRAPEDAAKTIELACQTSLAGGSIEDASNDPAAPILDEDLAVERVVAAVEAARRAPAGFVLTARAEAFLHGEAELDAVVRRLARFAEAGADVVYAPGLPTIESVRSVCGGVSAPVNVLVIGRLAQLPVEAFAEAGAARLSLGGALAWRAYSAMVEALKPLKAEGRFDGLRPVKDAAASVSRALIASTN